MSTTKWGFTDDMAALVIGSTTVAGLISFNGKATSDDSEVHVCGQRVPWQIVPGKQHFEITAEAILLDKETFWDRFDGSTNAFSGGVKYPAYYTIVDQVQNPYVGASTAHKISRTWASCLLNEPEWNFAQGDGIIIQKVTGMCESMSVAEVEPAD